MVDRISALAGHYYLGKSGITGEGDSSGVSLENIKGLVLYQVAAWPDNIDAAGKLVAKSVGCKEAPGPCKVEVGKNSAALRIEPLKWWLYGVEAPEVDAEQGSTLDISHSRTQIRISGPKAASLLNRHLSLDLREQSFPVGSVASSVMHHVGVTLWRSEKGYELFIPRGFALSLWEGLLDSAKQFGVEVL
jgi:heterotetrameric sarcosine oxidase gamma subunit